VSILAKLMLLYIATSAAASVLGGLIDYYYSYVISAENYW